MKRNTHVNEILDLSTIKHKEVINVGLELFVETLTQQGMNVIDVAFNPNADRPSDINDLLNKMLGE